MQITIGNQQNDGARARQEDYLASNSDDKPYRVAVLADGMGGYDGGQDASTIAAGAFLDAIKKHWGTNQYKGVNKIPDLLIDATYYANSALARAKKGNETNMGTTLVGLLIWEDRAWWVSVGDSLLFLYRDGHLQKINAEHSHYHDLRQRVFLGEISKEDAVNHPERDGLTSALMGRALKYVDVSRFGMQLQDNDCFLLASDGLTLSADDISELFHSDDDPQTLSDELVRKTMAKRDPHQDNVSVMVVEALEETSLVEKSAKTFFPVIMFLLAALLGAVVAVLVLDSKVIEQKVEKEEHEHVNNKPANNNCYEIVENFNGLCELIDESKWDSLNIKFACDSLQETARVDAICSESKNISTENIIIRRGDSKSYNNSFVSKDLIEKKIKFFEKELDKINRKYDEAKSKYKDVLDARRKEEADKGLDEINTLLHDVNDLLEVLDHEKRLIDEKVERWVAQARAELMSSQNSLVKNPSFTTQLKMELDKRTSKSHAYNARVSNRMESAKKIGNELKKLKEEAENFVENPSFFKKLFLGW